MTIILNIDEILFDLFPKAKESSNQFEALKEELVNYYSYSVYKPEIIFEGERVIIHIPTQAIAQEKQEYDKVVSFATKGKYEDAKRTLDTLIKKNPTNSEYYRIYGQILSDEGDQEGAINNLIDALRWDPKNGYALIMMGNVYAKHRDDIETAMKYYDQAVKLDPNNNIAINNIGANLLQKGQLSEGIRYLEKAYQIDSTYPNTTYGLALAAQKQGNAEKAFSMSIQALKLTTPKNHIYINALPIALQAAQDLIRLGRGQILLDLYRSKLEVASGKTIEVVSDPAISTAAKLELAENYKREVHIIRYKPTYPEVEHLTMHELVHLDFVIQARKEKNNMLFITNQEQKSAFITDIYDTIKKLKKQGYEERSIADFSTGLFVGLNMQIYNTPIDLFIESYLFKEFIDLRPYQLLSLYTLAKEGLNAVTDKKVVEISPRKTLINQKIYNIVNALQLKDLYGIDLVGSFQAQITEIKTAEKFFEEYKEYEKDRNPAEEYELVQHWADDLRLSKYFELVDEDSYRVKQGDPLGVLASIEEDPFDLESEDSYKRSQMDIFQEKAKELGLNMAVVMYMVDALQYFSQMNQEQIKKVAIEIAMLGIHGINPEKQGYKLNSIPGKSFSGYYLLAYYYVSWALAIPEMLKGLELPYDQEYVFAQSIHK